MKHKFSLTSSSILLVSDVIEICMAFLGLKYAGGQRSRLGFQSPSLYAIFLSALSECTRVTGVVKHLCFQST
jgi:hypothetical protein